jgi:hypothetical protein
MVQHSDSGSNEDPLTASLHQIERFLVGEGAMINHPEAGLQRLLDGFRGLSMGGEPYAAFARPLAGREYFLVAVADFVAASRAD